MNFHAFVDNVSVTVGSKFMPKYFREGIETLSLNEHLKMPDIELPGMFEAELLDPQKRDYNVTANSKVGKLSAGFRIAKWMGAKYPVIIYHHGASEIPFDYGFNRIFLTGKEKYSVQANLILIRAPFHGSMQEFKDGIRTLAGYMAMLAVSVKLIEAIVVYLRKSGVKKILLSGTSLGGYITNIHHIYFDSADIYVPLLAGTAMDDTFLNSTYSKAVDSKAKANPNVIQSLLNFETDFANQINSNVFPLLAKYDQLVRHERQKESYGQTPVYTIEKGHATGAMSYRLLREHIFQRLIKGNLR